MDLLQTVARAHGQVHGPGNYFSEFPDVSLGYSKGTMVRNKMGFLVYIF